jgi:hypothetical protein
MAKRDSFLLRVDPKILSAIRRWSEDEMRSMNGQIEYLLRDALKRCGRLGGESASNSPGAEVKGSDGSDPGRIAD